MQFDDYHHPMWFVLAIALVVVIVYSGMLKPVSFGHRRTNEAVHWCH